MTAPRVLNWGCGHQWQLCPPSWICSDVADYAQHHVGDILHDGLPYPTGHFDAVVSHHALQALGWHGVRPALTELARVIRPGGYLRLTVPDLTAGLAALRAGERGWFPVNQVDEPTVDGAFCAWLTWFGTNRTVFTYPWLADLLRGAGFDDVALAQFGNTAFEEHEIVAADDRPGESIFVEGRRT
jgi:SAM-dependent methyltransferase